MWLLMAVLSSVFAGLTAILAKCGIKHTDSDVATAVRTVVVLVFSWIMVFVVGSAGTISQIESRSLLFLILSGLATGMSWICYFKALSMADINKVVPIDKSSTILTVFLAILIFQETNHLAIKLVGVALIGFGVFLMIEKKDTSVTEQKGKSAAEQKDASAMENKDIADKVHKAAPAAEQKKGWYIYAVLSAVFAALTSILAKVGISGVESNLGTAIRTCVVLVMAWIIVFARGKHTQVKSIDRRELLFINLSGLATGASWLCYYYAIQNGVVSVVVPIDKLSIVVTIAFSYIFFGEKLKKRSAAGLGLMVAGTLLMAILA